MTEEETPKYTKKGGPVPAPVILPTAEEFEEVPVDLTMLVDAKTKIQNAGKLANEAAGAGIGVVKAIGIAAQMGDAALKAENDIKLTLRQIISSHNVTATEFRGFDFDRGVIRIQREPKK